MTITALDSSRAGTYRSFFLEGLLSHPEAFRIDPEDERDAPFPTCESESFTLAALDRDGAWMGVVSFRREGHNRVRLRHRGVLFRMYVAERYSGRGVGHALLAEVIERARTIEGVEQLTLTVIAGNARARNLYESFGFRLYGCEPRAVKLPNGRYLDEELMVLMLEG